MLGLQESHAEYRTETITSAVSFSLGAFMPTELFQNVESNDMIGKTSRESIDDVGYGDDVIRLCSILRPVPPPGLASM